MPEASSRPRQDTALSYQYYTADDIAAFVAIFNETHPTWLAKALTIMRLQDGDEAEELMHELWRYKSHIAITFDPILRQGVKIQADVDRLLGPNPRNGQRIQYNGNWSYTISDPPSGRTLTLGAHV